MTNPDVKEEKMPSGRSMKDIATALAQGDFIPAQGVAEELTVTVDGNERIISFDRLYYRQAKTENGIDWEDLNKQSHEKYKPNYYV